MLYLGWRTLDRFTFNNKLTFLIPLFIWVIWFHENSAISDNALNETWEERENRTRDSQI